MAKINILDSSVFNRIAAGEVVEKPRSIVKELVENSIDAGANCIEIHIENGGKSKIVIVDNGCGIESDYISTAFLPHATSKLSKCEDLDFISTLGFRGEALPSIASVSKVELFSKAIGETIGTKIYVEGGNIITTEKIDHNQGTTIIVKDLFFNTPARAKFLKKDKSEENDITGVVIDLIFSNADISFKYFIDNILIYSTTGNGLEDALYAVYPKEISSKLLVVHEKIGEFQISGYVSSPQLTKPNKSYQTCILNGRVISNSTISSAVLTAYGNSLMKRAFPIFVLDILMPFEKVDVNVTPNKSDVRFLNNQEVFSAIYKAIKTTLDKNIGIFNLSDSLKESNSDNYSFNNNSSKNKAIQENIFSNSNIKSIFDNNEKLKQAKNLNFIAQSENEVENKIVVPKKDIAEKFESLKNLKLEKGIISNFTQSQALKFNDVSLDIKIGKKIGENFLENFGESDIVSDSFPKSSAKQADFSTAHLQKNEKEKLNSQKFLDIDKIEITQLFNTYLFTEYQDNLYIIDQHAVHERIIYDSLKEQLDSKNIISQPMLFPQIVNLSASDFNYILGLKEALLDLGLEIEDFGNLTIKVSAVPNVLMDIDFNDLINCLLADKFKLNNIKNSDILSEKLAMTACKSAIKAGHKLSKEEVLRLIEQINENLPVQCPHGRPAIIKLNKKDFDKFFKRIL